MLQAIKKLFKKNKINMLAGFEYIVSYLAKYKRLYSLIALLGAFDSVYQGLIPLIYKKIFDNVFTQQVQTVPFMLLLVLGFGFIFFACINIYSRYLAAKAGAQIVKDIRLQLFQCYQSLTMKMKRTVQIGNFSNYFNNDLMLVEQGLLNQLPIMFQHLLRTTVAIGLIVYLQWFLALIMLILIPSIMFTTKSILQKANQYNGLQKKQEAKMTGLISEYVMLAPVIAVFNLATKINKRFEIALEKLKNISIKVNANTAFAGKIASANIDLIILLTILLSTVFAVKGYLSIGSVIAFLAGILLLGNSLAMLGYLIPQMLNSLTGLKNIEKFLQKRDLINNSAEQIVLKEKIKVIDFKKVYFCYDESISTLHNLSFSIQAGEAIGIVGVSGAGKSSILSLLLKQYKPIAGEITVNQYNLNDIQQQDWLSHLGVVFQESLLFSASIYENIKIGKLDATEEEVITAAKKAHVHDFIMTLPHQYHTKIGKQSLNDLSGGQRQRIAIARALIRKPEILLLDEITSALDANSEAAILQVIREVKKECTIIMVSHHFNSLELMDKIFVLNQGKITESGAHHDLIKNNQLYAQLWKTQKKIKY